MPVSTTLQFPGCIALEIVVSNAVAASVEFKVTVLTWKFLPRSMMMESNVFPDLHHEEHSAIADPQSNFMPSTVGPSEF